MNLNDVNGALPKTNIKGRDYVDVAARIRGFWMLHPEGSIQTELVTLTPDECVCKATVCDMGAVIATGHAQESRTASQVNRTSYVENCETSAVGRALGMLGIGSTDSIASAEEVEAAIAQQELEKAKRRFMDACKAAGVDCREEAARAKREVGYADTEAFWTAQAVALECS